MFPMRRPRPRRWICLVQCAGLGRAGQLACVKAQASAAQYRLTLASSISLWRTEFARVVWLELSRAAFVFFAPAFVLSWPISHLANATKKRSQ